MATVLRREFVSVPGTDIQVGDDRINGAGQAIAVVAVTDVRYGARGYYRIVHLEDGTSEQCWHCWLYRVGR